MNAPERISSLVLAPGIVLLRPAQRVDQVARETAARAIMRQLKRAKLSPPGSSGQDLLGELRSRHGPTALRP